MKAIVADQWRREHDAKLAVAAGDDLAIIRDQVHRGIAQLWKCSINSETWGYVVTRIEGPKGDQDFVIVLGEGKGFSEFMPHFVEYGRRHNMRIRTHVKRKGLLKMWARLGVTFNEYVLTG